MQIHNGFMQIFLSERVVEFAFFDYGYLALETKLSQTIDASNRSRIITSQNHHLT